MARGYNYPFVAVCRPAEFAFEANDCTVRALATSTGKSYAECHAYLKRCGRRDGKPFSVYVPYLGFGVSEYELLGADMFGNQRKITMTLGQWLRSGLLPRRCMVQVRGHVAAVVNNIVHDRYKTLYSGTRVRIVYAVPEAD